jgi:hypothetical protein
VILIAGRCRQCHTLISSGRKGGTGHVFGNYIRATGQEKFQQKRVSLWYRHAGHKT